ncbi:hypothetical protein [Peribacillus simplex]|uniref:Uncharacterized protein n=1 Tax=Peribacillus simplex TaxID=1478 RepID=A0A8B5XTE3_9BACI|nr:hypothetical protein [Peribacillus simplex]TVX75737.1 hypothetical protein FQP34_27085 [Peribacillus simplex]
MKKHKSKLLTNYYIKGIMLPIAHEKEYTPMPNMDMGTNVSAPSRNDKQTRSNTTNYTEGMALPIAHEKEYTPMPNMDMGTNVSAPSQNEKQIQSNAANLTQKQKDLKNQKTNNKINISIRNKNGNSIIN